MDCVLWEHMKNRLVRNTKPRPSSCSVAVDKSNSKHIWTCKSFEHSPFLLAINSLGPEMSLDSEIFQVFGYVVKGQETTDLQGKVG